MVKNQQIFFAICVKPNFMIDKDYFIWIAVIEDSYEIFKEWKINQIDSILILLHVDLNIQSKI